MKDRSTRHLNLKNRTIFYRDNIEVLRGINSESIDLIYLDPPFGKKDTWQASNVNQINKIRDYFLGLQQQEAHKNDYRLKNKDFNKIFANVSYRDTWRSDDVKDIQFAELSNFNNQLTSYLSSVQNSVAPGGFYYLIFMAVRLIEVHRILKDTGSLYLHCDTLMSHYLKTIMDKIFGENNFVNEIVWFYQTGGASKRHFSKKHDIILLYSKTAEYFINLKDAKDKRTDKALKRAKNPKGARIALGDNTKLPVDVWSIPALNPMAKERTGYPTQKPLALLEKIIKVSSNIGDVVLDPFCGCATTCIAAEHLHRQWIGIDKNEQAFYMNWYRLIHHVVELNKTALDLTDPQYLIKELTLLDTPPQRTDISAGELEKKSGESREIQKRIKADKLKSDREYKKNYDYFKEVLYEQQAGRCAACDIFIPLPDLTIDHVVPQSKRGDHGIDNLQLLCWRDNHYRGDKSMEYLLKKLLDLSLISKSTHDKQIKLWQEFRKNHGRIAKKYTELYPKQI